MDIQAEEHMQTDATTEVGLNGSENGKENVELAPVNPDRFRATNLYDRQIRLWGWEAQQRLMRSRLLMYGMNGVGAEVLKNLMLGGIKEITIVDDALVQEADLSTNFFVRREDFGQNRATASKGRAQLLSAACALTAVQGNVNILTEEWVRGYDLVVINGVSLTEAVRIGKVCRELRVPLFVSQVVGFHAFYVNDLNGLTFEVPPLGGEKPAGSGPKPKPKIIIDDDEDMPSTSRGRPTEAQVVCTDQAEESAPQSAQLEITVPDLASILTEDCARRSGLASPMPKRGGLKRIDPYLNMELILTFAAQKGRYPQYQYMEEDLKVLDHILGMIRPEGDTRVVEPNEFLRPDANFTCAIFGGTMAQEIITVLTRRGYPIFNLFYLAALDAMGSREYLQ
ncbi:putative SUMO-activating enzyme subunit 1 [Hypsibius exemplaris]|uniref:SUMO-activating enzyme subunit 1 n=1 Tax=Hypsibius exemplaris TaxID=2072580 RepID=A0A1W0WM84_HYPEX|nr:putative SUMO-activating enzyme subunit 1 [Hypsibius exemplaris]